MSLSHITISKVLLPLKIHTMTYCALGLIAGICWHNYYHWYADSLIGAVGVALLMVSGAVTFAKNGYIPSIKNRPLSLSMLFVRDITFVLFFFVLGAFIHHRQEQQWLNFQNRGQDKTYDLVGRITDVQEVRDSHIRQLITIKLERIREKDKNSWEFTTMTVQLGMQGWQRVKVADHVGIADAKFGSLRNETSFHLIKEGISSLIFGTTTTRILVLTRPAWSFSRFFWQQQQGVWKSLKKKLSPRSFSLFSLIFLGNKYANKELIEVYQSSFATWGISHHLARSGLHLILFILSLQFLLSFIPMRLLFKELLLLFVVMLYALLSWSSISFLRALVTFLLYKVCILFELPSNMLHILTLVVIFVLLQSPLQLFALDFQLSFVFTFGLAWLNYLQMQRKVLTA